MLFMEEVEKERFMKRIRAERKRKEYQRKLIFKAKVLSAILIILLAVIGVMI
ncbi:hypothetical protein KQI77_02285 [Clostridium sp. MSJ-8]|uniref:hypothetical protein n=1 Tax=Clostridium sp. MSJ-8 TaxID=2841510 RepID=UPI001C0EA7D1|nr:hypothetical protein [Clostridium sp. MSJ-8]MBU5486992.1 hypothetical protein [Clostridium sp. MSJ-8]